MFEFWSKNLLLSTANIEIDTTPLRFDYTGAAQTYIVPKGVKKLSVDCVGAKGTSGGTAGFGGAGGRVQCLLNVSPGQILYLYAGEQGSTTLGRASFNGGGFGESYIIRTAANGGGASDIRIGGTELINRKVIAGAGGGAASKSGAMYGGNGGGLIGEAGKDFGPATGGGGGTQTAGGIAGTGNAVVGKAGSFGKGADGAGNEASSPAGGGGYYGGGSGGVAYNKGSYYGGGGGGSSFTDPEVCSEVVHTQGYNNGNGYIILTPIN